MMLRPLALSSSSFRRSAAGRLVARFISGKMEGRAFSISKVSNDEGVQSGWRGHGRGRVRGSWRGAWRTQSSSDSKPKLTHFICVPLGHLPPVRSVAESFGTALLATTPSIDGLDPTIIVTPRRLHLTLGVMSLVDEDDGIPMVTQGEAHNNNNRNSKTVSAALSLLGALRPSILDGLDGQPLCVPLTSINIMKPERNDASRAHVMFAGPSKEDLLTDVGERLKRVCELINSEFTKSGFIVDEKRPLKLHCTLLNTSHRKPRPKGGYARRVPFSFDEIRASEAVQAVAKLPIHTVVNVEASEPLGAAVQVQESVVTTTRAPKDYSIPVDMGMHTVTEIQICKMGSWGAEGEYVCVGKIDLQI